MNISSQRHIDYEIVDEKIEELKASQAESIDVPVCQSFSNLTIFNIL